MKIFPSILSADFACLKPDVESVIESGVDRLHLDIMDGHFVPNISFGFPVVRSIAQEFPDARLDAHLMIEEPGKYLDPLFDVDVDWVSVHAEVNPPYEEILGRLHDNGVKAGIALNPDTAVDEVGVPLDRFDFVLLMTVQPGFGGQSFREDVLDKIETVSNRFDGPIQVDGGVGMETISRAADAGADWFVSGSSVFGADKPGKATTRLLERAEGQTED